MRIALVQIGAGEWSIARIYPDDDQAMQWWCGKHGWVSPQSSYWGGFRDCWNVLYPSNAAALRFARSQGWIE